MKPITDGSVMSANIWKIDMKTGPHFTNRSAAILASVLMAVLMTSVEAQKSRTPELRRNTDTAAKFAMSISDRQPILLKRFTTDSVAFVMKDELSDDVKTQQKRFAARETALSIYNRMTRKGFSVHSFEETPSRARDNMHNAIVIEGRIDQIEVRKKRPHVAVTVRIYAADDPGSVYAEIVTAGQFREVSARITQSFILSAESK